MARFEVLCQSASGREIRVTVDARTGQGACTRALAKLRRTAPAGHPDEGWRAIRPLLRGSAIR